ncbi:hypothetical protein TeGR_g629 [Tetraparma gracilis]|uniref:Uncharacterized protein n=1 Tax=Tetraparma gracilis TaxID=2962635 RepID=A0ABQ6NBH8_9STRA|nr:hypothetical protein TeGR_g629 [Tetraparma gracilis]
MARSPAARPGGGKSAASLHYGSDPRSILHKTSLSMERERHLERERKERKKKRDGKQMLVYNKWQRELAGMMEGVALRSAGESKPCGVEVWRTAELTRGAEELPPGETSPTTRGSPPLSPGIEMEESFVTQYDPDVSGALPPPSPGSFVDTQWPSGSTPSLVAESKEYGKWATDAALFKASADEFLTPGKKPPPELPRTVRHTTILGDANELATLPALDPRTSQPIPPPLSPSAPVDATMSSPLLLSKSRFHTEQEKDNKLLPPATVSSTNASLLKPEMARGSGAGTAPAPRLSPDKRPGSGKPRLYEMSWPVLTKGGGLEDRERENKIHEARLLHISGKLPLHVLESIADPAPPPHALGPTPLLPRTGGTLEPSFYGRSRNVSPTRLPASHYSLWQANSAEAPIAVGPGLGVMAFELPDPRPPPTLGEETPAPLAAPLGKGAHHDTTASSLAAPLSAAAVVPQSQPFGPDPDKPRLRELGFHDAMQFQGDLTPRTKLHHFRMFPFSTEAHEAAFRLQRFWGRHLAARMRAATMCQKHYRRMRTMREFREYVELVRFAKRAISGGVKRWIKRTRVTQESLIARDMLLEELSKEVGEAMHAQHIVDEKVRYAFTALLWRYRWRRRMKKRRRRRAELEQICAVRMQRGARYFLVRARRARQLDAHIVIKRSFRVYFFRVYKKQLRRVMNCWRSFILRGHIKNIQKSWRGIRGRRRAAKVRQVLTATEGTRGTRELEALNDVLSDVAEVMEAHLGTKAGMAELKTRVKEVKALFKARKKDVPAPDKAANADKEAKAAAAKAAKDAKTAALVAAVLAMYEVGEDGDPTKTDGFVDVGSFKAALGWIKAGEEAIAGEEEADEAARELDVFKNGLLPSNLVVGWVMKREEELRTAPPPDGSKKSGGGKCWGGGLAASVGQEAYVGAARRSMLEKERKRYMLKCLEAYRGGGEKPRVVCEGCLRPFPFHTVAAQRHIQNGGCVMRPSAFLPLAKSDFN